MNEFPTFRPSTDQLHEHAVKCLSNLPLPSLEAMKLEKFWQAHWNAINAGFGWTVSENERTARKAEIATAFGRAYEELLNNLKKNRETTLAEIRARAKDVLLERDKWEQGDMAPYDLGVTEFRAMSEEEAYMLNLDERDFSNEWRSVFGDLSNEYLELEDLGPMNMRYTEYQHFFVAFNRRLGWHYGNGSGERQRIVSVPDVDRQKFSNKEQATTAALEWKAQEEEAYQESLKSSKLPRLTTSNYADEEF